MGADIEPLTEEQFLERVKEQFPHVNILLGSNDGRMKFSDRAMQIIGAKNKDEILDINTLAIDARISPDTNHACFGN